MLIYQIPWTWRQYKIWNPFSQVQQCSQWSNKAAPSWERSQRSWGTANGHSFSDSWNERTMFQNARAVSTLGSVRPLKTSSRMYVLYSICLSVKVTRTLATAPNCPCLAFLYIHKGETSVTKVIRLHIFVEKHNYNCMKVLHLYVHIPTSFLRT